MQPAIIDVPLALALAAAGVLGALQVAAYTMATRALETLCGAPWWPAPIALLILLFGVGAALGDSLSPPAAAAAVVGPLAAAALVGTLWAWARRRAAWRLLLAAPACARRLGVASITRGIVLAGLALATMATVAALGGGPVPAAPGWAPLLLALALRSTVALPLAAAAAALDVACTRLVLANGYAGDTVGIALAVTTILAAPLAAPGLLRQPAG